MNKKSMLVAAAWAVAIVWLIGALAVGALSNETGTEIEASSVTCNSFFFVILFTILVLTSAAIKPVEGKD